MADEHDTKAGQVIGDSAAKEDGAAKSTVELSEQDLEKVAGGVSVDSAVLDVAARKKVLDGKTDRRQIV
jgi:hypothetical protein